MERQDNHKIAILLDDKISKIRENAYLALLNLCEFLEGRQHICDSELIIKLVNKITEEKDD